MIVKPNDFKGEFAIQSVAENSVDSALFPSETNQLFEDREKEVLIRLLGFQLYKTLIDNVDLTQTNRLKTTAAPELDKLLNGDGIYEGLLPILKSYIYFYWLSDKVSFLSTIGNIEVESKASKNVNSHQKAVKAWRYFYSKAYGKEQTYAFEKWDLPCIIYEDETQNDSLYYYLEQNKASYHELVMNYSAFKNMNVF